jgi:hypothetical protein
VWHNNYNLYYKTILPVILTEGKDLIFLKVKIIRFIYSDCQKFFPIPYLIVGARRAVPLKPLGMARHAPTNHYFWQSL